MKRVILAFFISLSTVFVLFSTSVSASTALQTQSYEIERNDYNGGNFYWTTGINFSTPAQGVYGITAIQANNQSVSVGNNNYFSARYTFTIAGSTLFWGNNPITVDACRFGWTSATDLQSSYSIQTTSTSTGWIYYNVTAYVTGQIPRNTTGAFVCSMRATNGGYIFTNSNNFNTVNFTGDYGGATGSIEFSNDRSDLIINQNNQMINQQKQLIDIGNSNNQELHQLNDQQYQTNQNLNNINDSITDSNVQGDFSVSAIPAFGPIAGILNNLLELPRILLAVPACTPIRPTLPFVHQDIEIPCMSTIYAQAYPAFITFLDAIASAYIWFRVARYIVRQVQHLRDPEQEDEEYLDI